MTRYVFVGERPSPRAAATGATWQNGRLAAKVLHDALRANGHDPDAAEYVNLWRTPGLGTKDLTASDRLHAFVVIVGLYRRTLRGRIVVVALGNTVAQVLNERGVPHRKLVHPAARGAIRQRERYQAHVKAVLGAPNV